MILSEVPGVIECAILRRLNRFVVEVAVGGRTARAYINNTGRLAEYMAYGRKAYCVRNAPAMKTEYRLFAVSEGGLGALIDTRMQMSSFEEAVGRGLISWLRGCGIARRNVRLGSSIIDCLVRCGSSLWYVEVKSAVMRGDRRYAMYPDCPTRRGRRHIYEITRHVLRGGRGAIVFIAGLPNVEAFRPYAGGDPEIPALLRRAVDAGVEVRALSLYYDPAISAIVLYRDDLEINLIS